MSLSAGFAEIDITPPVGTHKIGWLRDSVADRIADPLFARVAVLESQGQHLSFVQLDTLSIRWTQTNAIRQTVAKQYGVAGNRIMVAATHNHAGPAVANCGLVRRDEAYTEALVDKIVLAVGQAMANLQEAQLGMGSCFEVDVAHNRRVVMRDGTVRTHGNFDDPDALHVEGPIDPELAVLAARDTGGRWLGAIVNFACHPTHYGADTTLSAGYPGILAATMKDRGCPVTLFLNGAAGNIHTSNPYAGGADMPMDQVGRRLADDTSDVMTGLAFRDSVRLRSCCRTIALPYRKVTEDEIAGTVRGAQRFVDPAIYDRTMPALIERIEQRRTQPAEVQVHFIDEVAYVGVPAEYFVELGLRIKQGAHPQHALVVGWANGMVGYVPHREAFARGGYETTFTHSSRMAPEAGQMLADCAIELIRKEDQGGEPGS
jgi:hypothetical protein